MNKIENKLFEEVYNSIIADDFKTVDIPSFINYCENVYKMTTEEFRKWFEINDYEGNVDQQLWYKYTVS